MFAAPGEIGLLWLGSEGEDNRLDWCSAELGAGSGTLYDVARGAVGEFPVGSGASELCVGPGLTQPTMTDLGLPTARTGFWYLVRGRNACAIGTYGFRSNAVERTTFACP